MAFFDFNGSFLMPDGQKIADAAAAADKRNGAVKPMAYTDLAGTVTCNLALSMRPWLSVPFGAER